MVPSGAFESKRKVSVSIFASCWIKGALCSLGEEIENRDFNIENVNEVSPKGSKAFFFFLSLILTVFSPVFMT